EVVLQNAEIGLVDSRHAGKRRPTGGSGRVIVIAAARKADRIVFVVREEKQLVFLQRSADVAAEAVHVITRVLRAARENIQWIGGVEIAILQILIEHPVE